MTTLTTGTLQLVDKSDLSYAVGEINDLLVIHDSNLLKEELTSQIKRMTSQFDDIRHFLSKQNPGYKRDTADVLLEVATNAAVDAKSIIDDFLLNTKHRLLNKSKFPYINKLKGLVAQREAIKKLEFIRIQISRVFEREKQNYSTRLPDPVTKGLSYYSDPTRDERDRIVAREEDIKMITKLILEDTHCFRVISVVGMACTGKTAITEAIYNDAAIRHHFDSVAGVVYGPSLTVSQQLNFIGNKFNVIHDDKEVLTMKKKIYDYLINQRYFIALDDIMTTEAWDDISEAFPMSQLQYGSRILLTTRNRRVALHATRDQVGTSPYTTIGPLNEDDSWELFKHKVRIHHFSQVPLNLEPIGKEIVKKCDGLPGAIAQVAKAEIISWNNLCFSSTNSYQLMNDEPEAPWSYIFKKIISDLPLHLKRCLFYFGHFPKNYKIPVRRLIGLWVAEGLVKQNDQPVAADEYVRAREYLQELIDREMIQVTKENSNGRPMKCCLAFFLREHLPSRVRPAGNHVSSLSSRNLGVRHLVDDPKDNQPTILRSSKYASLESYRFLSSFMSFDFREGSVPGEQIRGFLYRGVNKGCFQLLRVLDLENVYKPILPIELGKLIYLRYLGLRRTSLDKIPSFLVNLFNLQTLDLKHTFITTFPNSVWKLKQLRHLCLNKGHKGASMDAPSALDNLQTLSGIYVKDDSLVKGGLDRLTNLTKLALACDFTSKPQQDDAVAKWIFKLTSLESLALRSHNASSVLSLVHFRDHMHLFNLYSFGRLEKLFEENEFPPNLTELTLSASKLQEDPLPVLGKLPNLIILGLYSESYIREQMVCPSSGFQRLRVLKIWKLEKLEILSFEGAMPVLNKLDIRWCKNLKKLPLGLQQIVTLQELKLSDVSEEFKAEIEQHKDEEWYNKASVEVKDENDQTSKFKW